MRALEGNLGDRLVHLLVVAGVCRTRGRVQVAEVIETRVLREERRSLPKLVAGVEVLLRVLLLARSHLELARVPQRRVRFRLGERVVVDEERLVPSVVSDPVALHVGAIRS